MKTTHVNHGRMSKLYSVDSQTHMAHNHRQEENNNNNASNGDGQEENIHNTPIKQN